MFCDILRFKVKVSLSPSRGAESGRDHDGERVLHQWCDDGCGNSAGTMTQETIEVASLAQGLGFKV